MTEENELEFRKLKTPEKKRTYLFSDGQQVSFKDVTDVCIRPSGIHRLNLGNGEKVIVSCGWRAIVLDIDEWEF